MMKKNLRKRVIPLVCLTLLWVFILPFTAKSQTTWNGTSDVSWYNESQTSFDISTAEQLAGLAKLVNEGTYFRGKTINLVADIKLNADSGASGYGARNWTPIGGLPGGLVLAESGQHIDNRYFEGTFNGNYHKIYYMACRKSANYHAGLFGAIRSGSDFSAKIQNVILIKPVIWAKGMAGHVVGFIARGHSAADAADMGISYIENCMVVNGSIQGGATSPTAFSATGGNHIGSIIGATYPVGDAGIATQITNCCATGYVSGNYAGGLVGNGAKVKIENSYFAGTVVNLNPDFPSAGIIAHAAPANPAVVTNCYSNIAEYPSTTDPRPYSGTIKTLAEMNNANFAKLLGSGYKPDIYQLNHGYPVFAGIGIKVDGVTDICLGSSTVLTASGWDSYSWNTGAKTAAITVSPTTTTTYTVTGTKGGSSMTDYVTVTVHSTIEVVSGTTPHNTATITFPEGATGSYTAPCAVQAPVNVTVTANAGYYITQILVNGNEVAAFTPEDVKSIHTFSFNPEGNLNWDVQVRLDNKYKIDLSSVLKDYKGVENPINGGSLGLVTPWGDNGIIWMTYGNDTTIQFGETNQYKLQDVIHNSTSLGYLTTLDLKNITSHQTVKAVYVDNCAIVSFPHTEGFTEYLPGSFYGTFPECWNRSSTTNYMPYVMETGNKDANSIYFYVHNNSGYCLLTTPLIDEDITLLCVKFASQSTNSATFEIGVMTDPTDLNTFEAVENYKYAQSTAYTDHITYFNKYKGNGKYIAFKLSQVGPAYFSLDNIEIDYISLCTEIQNVTASNIGGTSALITWQNQSDDGSEYEIEVEDNDGDVVFSGFTKKLSYIITGLKSYTNYVVKVRTVCDNNNGWATTNMRTASLYGCNVPNLFRVGEIEATSAVVSWVKNDTVSSQYIIEYRENGATNWTQQQINDLNEIGEYALVDLNPNTEYTVRLCLRCERLEKNEEGEWVTVTYSTAWTTLSFHTLCLPYTTLPFVENFDRTQGNPLPACWIIHASNANYKPYVQTQASPISPDFYSAYGALNFNNTYSATNIVVLPSIQEFEIKDLQVSFMAKVSDNNTGTFTVGVMTDPNDISTFVSVNTIGSFAQNNVWQDFEIPLSSYAEAGSYIAFMWKNGGSSSLLMDNLYIDEIPTCPKPISLTIDSITSNTVFFSWVDGNSMVWDAVCVPVGTTLNWDDASLVVGNSGSITGLKHTTQYELYFRAVCGGTPLYAAFKTDCDLITDDDLPYTESFDTYGVGSNFFPSCWTRTNVSAPYISNTYSSAPGALYCNYSRPTELLIATPEFNLDISTVQVDLKLSFSDLTCGFIVGVMTDPTVSTSFVPVDTIFGTEVNVWGNYTVYFDQYIENGKYIAFRISDFGVNNYTIYVDDIIVNKMGMCISPNGISASDISNNKATISWNENGNATEWEVAYGPSGFNPNNDEGDVLIVNGTTDTTLTSLATNTLYDVYVRANCNNGEYSNWSSVRFSFYTTQTPCTLPYQCDFENDAKNAEWVLINGEQANQWNIGGAVKSSSGGNNKSLYISNTNGTTLAYNNTATSYVYALQTLDFTVAGVYEFSFDWRANGEFGYDLMKVFLIPTSMRPEAGNAYGMVANGNTTPTDWIDIGNGSRNLSNAWTSRNVEFTIDNPSLYYLAVFWKNNNSGGNQSPAAIDNILIQRQACSSPIDLKVTNFSNTAATISWSDDSSITAWEVQYGSKGFELGSGTSSFVTNKTHTITNLLPDFTAYGVYVRAICGNGDSSRWTGPVTFRTQQQQPASLPYTCNFENDTENGNWGLINGNQTNKWAIDEADNNGGLKSLYVSNSNGAKNEYTQGVTSYVYAMRALNFEAQGVYEIEFDWKANGLESFDILRAFLVPVSEIIDDGNAYTMVGANTTVPAEWIDISNGNLSQQTTWQHIYSKITMSNVGTYNLVFFWKNYAYSNGEQTPGAVDNISIRIESCPLPSTVSFFNVTTTTATLVWTEFGEASDWEIQYGMNGFVLGSGTKQSVSGSTSCIISGLSANNSYDVYVRAVCGAGDTSTWATKTTFKTPCTSGITQLPYFENFDTYDNGVAIPTTKRDVIPNCWISRKIDGASNMPYIANGGATYSSSAPYALDFSYTPNNSSSIAIMPEIDASISMNDLQLSFWCKTEVGAAGTFYVGIMNDPYIDGGFTMVASYTNPSNTPQRHTISLADYTGTGRYIAFRWMNSSNNNRFVLDDVELKLSTTTEPCTPPTSLSTSNITDNSATVTWTAGGSETSWSVEYKKASESNYSTPTTATTTTHNLTNLTANTDYDVRVKAICGSDYSAGVTTQFKTTTQSPITYTITPRAGDNGTINPSSPVTVNQGDSQTFTFTANQNYLVDSIWVDDVLVGVSNSTHTIENVQADMTIYVTFKYDLAVPQHYLDNSVLVYPNPASEQLTVKLSASFEQLEITNLLGQVIYTANVNDTEFTINVNDYRSGVYFIRLTGNQGVATKKFIRE